MMNSHRKSVSGNEAGAILPIFALMIVVLLVFAAFTVDLGSAWAERRQDQTAADAAAMAAGLQYLSDDDSPSSDELISIVIDYTSRNLPNPPTLAEWQGCVDTDKPDEFYVSLTSDGGVEYDCISLRQESSAPTRLRVQLPTRDVPTHFAALIGVDSIAVSAAAIVEIEWSQVAKVLPFSVPAQPNLEECLGVPPNGHNDGEIAPCEDGTDSGNFGLLNSPWFGAGPPTYEYDTGDSCTESDYEGRTELNLALGLDHTIKVWPHDDPPPVNADLKNENTYDGQDTCTAIEDGSDPYVLITAQGTETGNAAVFSDGMIGTTAVGSYPGKIRQVGGLNDGVTGSGEFSDRLSLDGLQIDNVGLWQYLDGSYNGECAFPDASVVGRGRTVQILNCVKPGGEVPSFGMDLIESPRFAVVPSLSYESGAMSGASGYAILDLIPVYIQSTWYDCTGTGVDCLFHPADFVNEAMNVTAPWEWDDTVPMWYSPVFNPGEGDTVPCKSNKGYDPVEYEKKPGDFDCVNPTDMVLKGASAIVLDWDWFPEDAENAIGNNSPYLVQMYR